jgi:hypothetical protein
MTDIETRLRADAQHWQERIDSPLSDLATPVHQPVSTRRARRWLAPAIAALAVAGLAVALAIARPFAAPSQHHSSPGAQPTPPGCASGPSGPTIAALSPGTAPVHDAATAQRVATTAETAPEHITAIYPALVTNPSGIKLDIPTAPRIMWVIAGTITYQDSPPFLGSGGARLPNEPPIADGTIYHLIALVDDQTLQPGGTFLCGPPEPPNK